MGKWLARKIIMNVDYKSAGVNIEAGNQAVNRIKQSVESTFTTAVLTEIGNFASMFDLKDILREYQHPVLVQSIDGVGTKIMIAQMMNKFDTIGIDLVSATANDIIVLGAKPLSLLDYIANDKLNPDVIEQIMLGMTQACRENNIALVGGETAEMPGTYIKGEHDLVGAITGIVEKDKAILGKSIQKNDLVLAFSSSGLHTNGYSLARKLFFDMAQFKVDTYLSELSCSLGEALLQAHINYTQPILQLLANHIPIHGMAHITGGGLLENIPRILPVSCDVEIDKAKLPNLPIFNILRHLSKLDDDEMYRTFNMGVGYIIIVPPPAVAHIKVVLQSFGNFSCIEIGKVIAGNKKVRLI